MQDTKTILLIGNEFLPLPVPGSFRLQSFAKHLPKYNYFTHILCDGERSKNQNSWLEEDLSLVKGENGFKVTRASFKRKKNFYRQINRFEHLLFPHKWPVELLNSYKVSIDEIWRKEKIDAIVATVPPLTPLSAAHWAAKKYNVPWIIDFRDVFGEHGINWKHYFTRPYYLRMKHSESYYARKANGVITVSKGLRKKVLDYGADKVNVLINGYSPEEYQKSQKAIFDKFTILYAGATYIQYRPELLLDALDQILTEGKIKDNEIQTLFYGSDISNQIGNRRCGKIITCYSRVPKEKIIPFLMGAHILLHFSIPNKTGIMTSKITEYLGAGRPIVSIPGDGDAVDEFLKETKAGVSLGSVELIKHHLIMQYEHWRDTGSVIYDPEEKTKQFYTRERQTKVLANLLDGILKNR